MTRYQAEIILALAENGLRITPTAKAMFLHPNTITYHVRQIKIELGRDPQDFYDMCRLLPEARRLLKESKKWL